MTFNLVLMINNRAARYWKKTHIAIFFFFCNIYCDMKKRKKIKKSPDDLNFSIWKKNINDWGDFIGE